MNTAIIMGRLTKEPAITTTQSGLHIARYTLAVDRKVKQEKENQQTADFIPCVAFDKAAEFAGKYFHQGMRVLVEGRIQTGSYKDREGRTVYTTDVIVSSQEFADGKRDQAPAQTPAPDEFLSVPEGADETDGLPFA